MESDFDLAFEFAMKWEKWKSSDPKDLGGITIWGISSRYFPQIVEKLKNLTEDESLQFAKLFYREEFWKKAGCENYRWPENIALFDSAINLGIAGAICIPLQNWQNYLFLRIQKYSRIVQQEPQKLYFFRGWINRVVDLYQYINNQNMEKENERV